MVTDLRLELAMLEEEIAVKQKRVKEIEEAFYRDVQKIEAECEFHRDLHFTTKFTCFIKCLELEVVDVDSLLDAYAVSLEQGHSSKEAEEQVLRMLKRRLIG